MIKENRKYKREDIIYGYLFILPLLIGMIIFYIYPIFRTIYYSFTKWGMFGGTTFIGLDNYKNLFKDPELYGALKNTFVYTLFMVPLSMIFSILFASLLNQKIKLKGFFRTIYFLPAVTMVTASAMIFKWIFNGDYGIFNSLIGVFGFEKVNWISDGRYAMAVIVVLGVWLSLGRNIILYLAGLQGIPSSYYEAAQLDGASPLQTFFSITIPLLTPTMFFQLTTGIIGALQLYDVIFVIFTPTNPALKSVTSMAYLFYRQGFTMNNKGYAATIAVVLLMCTLIVTAINFLFQKKWVNYE